MAGRVIGTATVQVKADTSGFKNGLSGIGGTLSKIGGGFSKLGGAIGALGLTNVAKDAVSMGTTYRVQMDNAAASVRGLVTDQDKANKLLQEMTNFAIKTPFDLPGVQNVTTRLLAVGKGFGVTADNVLNYTETLGNVAAINGKGSDSMLNVANIMGRVSGQGRIMTKDMNQLTANFPSLHPWEILSEMTGKTEQDLRKLASKPGGLSGIVSATDFIDKLKTTMENADGVAGAMDRKMATLGGTFELFKDTMGVALANGLQPFFTALQGGMNSSAIADGLGALITVFSELATMVITEVAPLIPDLITNFTLVADSIKPAMPLVGALVRAFSSMLKVIAPLIGFIAVLAGHLADFMDSLSPNVLGAITAALVVLWAVGFGPVGIISALVVGLALVIVENWDTIVEVTKMLIGGLITAWDAVVRAFRTTIRDIVGAFHIFIDAIVTGWNWLFDNVLQPIGDFVMGIIHFFETLYDTLVGNSIIPDLVNAIVGWFQTLFGFVKTIFQAIWDFIVAVWDGIKAAFDVVLGAIETVITTYFNIYKTIVETVFNAVKDFIGIVWDAIKTAFDVVLGAIETVITTYFNIYKTIVETVFNAVKDFISLVWNGIKAAIDLVLLGIKTSVEFWFGLIKGLAHAVWDGLQAIVSGIWDAIKGAIIDPILAAYEFVSDKLHWIFNLFARIWSGLKDVVSGIWDGIKEAITGPILAAYNFVFDKVNAIKGLVDKAIGWISKIPGAGTVVSAVEQVAGHARGGIISQPTLSWLGEGHRAEAIIPLTNPGRAMQIMQQSGLDRLAGQMGSSRGFSGPIVTMPGAIIQDATDADLVAQRTLVALQAAMVA